MATKEFSAEEIAAALGGRPGGQGPELRLLMLFQSEAGDPVDAEPHFVPDAVRKAA
jgi:hypothetical protein